MDSLTQLTLGAAVGEAVLGPKVGRKALLWGGLLGTLPDLDVFIPLDGPVERFVYHRGFSHSVFLLALASPLLAWTIARIHSATGEHFKRWWLLTFLVLEGSVLLDFLTVYGTQLLWPFGNTPLAWPVFFIIDPLFTAPLLVGCLAALLSRGGRGHRWNRIGLVVALVYMAWAISARELVMHQELLHGLEEHPPVTQLRWFTRGWYAVDDEGGEIVMTDLRMGSEPDYVFRFKIARRGTPHPVPIEGEKLPTDMDWERLRWIRERIGRPMPPP